MCGDMFHKLKHFIITVIGTSNKKHLLTLQLPPIKYYIIFIGWWQEVA
jgi:hypothetical protein